MPDYEWTAEKVQQLIDLAQGDDHPSCKALAATLGISKNAIAGKLHRLAKAGRLSGRTVTRRSQLDRFRAKRAAASVAAPTESDVSPQPILPPPIAPAIPLDIAYATESTFGVEPAEGASIAVRCDRPLVPVPPIDLPADPARSTCCWPMWQGSERSGRFCGKPRGRHRNYCPEHVELGTIRRAMVISEAA